MSRKDLLSFPVSWTGNADLRLLPHFLAPAELQEQCRDHSSAPAELQEQCRDHSSAPAELQEQCSDHSSAPAELQEQCRDLSSAPELLPSFPVSWTLNADLRLLPHYKKGGINVE